MKTLNDSYWKISTQRIQNCEENDTNYMYKFSIKKPFADQEKFKIIKGFIFKHLRSIMVT